MKVKSVNVANGSVVVNYVNKENEDCSYWFNGTTDVAAATSAFVALMNAGLIWPAFNIDSTDSIYSNISAIGIVVFSHYNHTLI